jgi:hypothetical protein
LLERAANGSQEAQKKLLEFLREILVSDSLLKQEVGQLAEEIYQVVQFDDVNARNVQQVFGGQGLQVNDPKSPVIQAGENAKIYIGFPPQD